MRVFVGTFLNPANQRVCEHIVRDLVHEHREVIHGVPDGSVHITHAFCPQAGDGDINDIQRALNGAAETSRAFDIRFGAPHVIAAGSRPRLVCAAIVDDDGACSRIGANVFTRLRSACPHLPFSPSRTPHVTLARFRKSAGRADARAVEQSISNRADSVLHRDRIERLEVVVSVLTPTGPRYEIVVGASLMTSERIS
jgi:2'-5' RNA ligase